MTIQALTDEQIATYSRAQKDEWWFKNVFRGDMPQLTLRSGLTGFVLGGRVWPEVVFRHDEARVQSSPVVHLCRDFGARSGKAMSWPMLFSVLRCKCGSRDFRRSRPRHLEILIGILFRPYRCQGCGRRLLKLHWRGRY